MDYEKAYKEALAKAKETINYYKEHNRGDEASIEDLEEIFPELKESEDERIRKALVRFHKSTIDVDGIKGEDIIAWLEKQGEKKVPINDFKAKNWYVSEVDGKIHDMTYNPAKKVEPKFKVGDWIVNNEDGSIGQITDIIYDESGYGYNHTNGWLHSVFEKDFHLWTIQDAKDGDVLVDDLGNICIYQEPSTKLMYHSYCYGKHKYFIDMGGSHEIVGTCPATKGQRDLLFQKMKEAGYQWNPDTKELKKVEQNPTWSDEDERMCQETIDWFEKKCFPYALEHENPARESIMWLKSLKERLS